MWLSGWAQRIKLTSDNTKVDSDLTHFAIGVLLKAGNGETTEVFNEVGANKYKIAIADGAGTQFYVEIELWDNGNSVAALHFGKTGEVLPSAADKDYYLYYDNTHADNTTYVGVTGEAAAEAVWDANHKMVQHMNDNPDTSSIMDSTSNDNDGTKTGANEPIEAAGEIGKAQDFDGNDDDIDLGNGASLQIAAAITVTAMLSIAEWKSQYAVHKYNSAKGWIFGSDPSNPYKKARFKVYEDGTHYNQRASTTELALDTTYVITGVFDGGAPDIYVNGVLDNGALTGVNTPSVITDSGASAEFGEYAAGSFLHGSIDEVRISDIARSADWIKATNATLRDTLLTYGNVESFPSVAMHHYRQLREN